MEMTHSGPGFSFIDDPICSRRRGGVFLTHHNSGYGQSSTLQVGYIDKLSRRADAPRAYIANCDAKLNPAAQFHRDVKTVRYAIAHRALIRIRANTYRSGLIGLAYHPAVVAKQYAVDLEVRYMTTIRLAGES